MKTCAACKENLPETDFGKCKSSKDNLYSYCKSCKREKSKASYARALAADPRLVKEKRKAKYQRNREQTLKTNREWSRRNKDRHRQLIRQWRKENRDYEYAKNREWAKNNRERMNVLLRAYEARKRAAATIPFTHDQLAQKFSYWGNACWVCRGSVEAADHVKPISKGGPHMLANLRPICKPCNSSKGNKWPFRPSGRDPITGKSSYHIQASTLDNGSAWVRNTMGEDGDPALTVFAINDDGFDLRSFALL